MKRPRSSTAPVGALAIAHQLKAGSADEQAAAAQALLDDDEQKNTTLKGRQVL